MHDKLHVVTIRTDSLVPRLSPRAKEVLQATESWAGPGNEANVLTELQKKNAEVFCGAKI